MLRILDRYLLREIALPFLLGLTILTFILVLPPILVAGEEFISKGVEWSIVARAMATLLPQALSLTIPMAVLLGILVGFGRLSADREFVAMQACGVSLARLLRPVLLIAVLGTAATAYEIIVALPNANQAYRDIVFVLLATRVENNVKPRVFYEDFPNKTIYVQDVPAGGGWKDVFLADTSRPGETTVYFAKQGRIRLDSAKRIVQLELLDVTSHTTRVDSGDSYQANVVGSTLISLDPDTVFKRPLPKGAPEMTIAELKAEIAEAGTRRDPAYNARFMLQQKFSLPITCPILALIGLALGASNRKDGKLASFAIGMGVIFAYYVLLWGARAAAMGGRFSPELAPWLPNIVMGTVALVMYAWRTRSADQPLTLRVPAFLKRTKGDATATRDAGTVSGSRAATRPRRASSLSFPGPRLLDLYVSREYLRVFALGIVGLLGIFYISTFIDLVDKLFRGDTTSAMLLRYFYYRTPQFVYYVIPMGVLVSTLVTIGVMTKNSELLVMRACGISLYRTAAPLLLFAALASGVLFLMQERVLATANREADRLERVIRRWPPVTNALSRRWVVGRDHEIYHFDFFDADANRFSNLAIYRIDEAAWGLHSITQAASVTAISETPASTVNAWVGTHGWTRETVPASGPPGHAGRTAPTAVTYTPFERTMLTAELPAYFKSDEPVAEMMTFAQLQEYIARLKASGANVVPQMVALQRKIAFPLVTLVMTILAVPFAVTTGRRGAMYGVGIGIVLAITYWITMSISGALGAGGALSPMLAAWAPNILFGSVAAYLVLTVRT